MKDLIIKESIESLRKEGLKFSVDTLADRLKISKKTIYKFFPDKEKLALALYEQYYDDAKEKAKRMILNSKDSVCYELLYLYFDSKIMIRSDIFNKYKLNEIIYSYAMLKNDELWNIISKFFDDLGSKSDMKTFKIIVDGSFENLCKFGIKPDNVIERLVQLI
ncbi:MAG: TetR/AcrR family transcriptional regulator [Acutalibacteraceae bacterium]